jgi:hypothetical protein
MILVEVITPADTQPLDLPQTEQWRCGTGHDAKSVALADGFLKAIGQGVMGRSAVELSPPHC